MILFNRKPFVLYLTELDFIMYRIRFDKLEQINFGPKYVFLYEKKLEKLHIATELNNYFEYIICYR